ncbi:MAG: hypothetical protein AAGD96_30770 [Chloroflexota bacterium]
MTIEKYLGKWIMDTSRSNYQLGDPPQKGTYDIIQEDDRLVFLMDWVDQAGDQKQMSFSEICDGEFHPYHNSPAVDEIQLQLMDGPILQSLAKKDGIIIMEAQRELLSEQLMKVTMGGPLPDGSSYQNISFYEKPATD